MRDLADRDSEPAAGASDSGTNGADRYAKCGRCLVV
jgi:hypothetical protein